MSTTSTTSPSATLDPETTNEPGSFRSKVVLTGILHSRFISRHRSCTVPPAVIGGILILSVMTLFMLFKVGYNYASTSVFKPKVIPDLAYGPAEAGTRPTKEPS